MSEASIKAYKDIQPQVPKAEERILALLSDGVSRTLREVAKALSMPLQTASARLSELNDNGIVSSVTAYGHYMITPKEDVAKVKRGRDNNRYRKWLRLGEKHGYFMRKEIELIESCYDEDGNPKYPRTDG